jgi:hypothetical protein
MYRIYNNDKYLKTIERNVTEKDLKKFGKVTNKIYKNYDLDKDDSIGYVLVDGLKKFYAILESEEREK